MPGAPRLGPAAVPKPAASPCLRAQSHLKKKKKANFFRVIFLTFPYSSVNMCGLSGPSADENIVLVSKRLQFEVQLTVFKTQSCIFSDYH